MRRILFLFSLLFLLIPVEAQKVIRANPVYNKVATVAGGYCAEYQAVYNACSSKPGTDTANVLNTFVESAKTHGYWAKADVIYFLAAKNSTDALLCWVDPDGDDNCTNVHATAFTQWAGFAGDGSNDYLSTNYTPSSEKVNYGATSATVGAYCRLDKSENGIVIGCNDGTDKINLYPKYTDNKFYLRLNSSVPDGGTVTNGYGFFVGSRSGNTTTEGYRNGTTIFDGVGLVHDIPVGGMVQILADGAGSTLSTNQVSFVFIGGLLTDQQVIDMKTDVEVVMDYLGKGIIP